MPQLWELQHAGAVQKKNLAGQQDIALPVEASHARVRRLCGLVDLGCLKFLVIAKLLGQFQDAHQMIGALRGALDQGNFLTFMEGVSLLAGNGQRHGHGPRQPIGQAHILQHRLVGQLVHESGQRTKSADGDHLQIGDSHRREIHFG